MSQRRVIVASPMGLHARPAALFVQAAAAQPVPVTIRLGDGTPVDARSLLSVMGLGARCGDEVTLHAEDGPHADTVLTHLSTLLATPS
jgi:phosphocarrier protein